MQGIFISYRRKDSQSAAGRLADHVKENMPGVPVFRDVETIEPGVDFTEAINRALQSCGVLLAVIGPHWMSLIDAAEHRDHPIDYTRLEIATALARANVRVIPVLVEGAQMPEPGNLPEDLQALCRRHAIELTDKRWNFDVSQLIEALRKVLDIEPPAPEPRPLPHSQPVPPSVQPAWYHRLSKKQWGGIAAAVVGLVAMAWAIQTWRLPPPLEPTQSSPPSVQTIDITGRWTARVKYDWGDQHDEVFEFKYLGDTLHGTATYQTGRLTIEQAKLKGDWISFVTRSQEMLGSDSPWKEVTHRYTGQVTPKAIRFTLESGGGYSIHPPVEFTAQRVPKS